MVICFIVFSLARGPESSSFLFRSGHAMPCPWCLGIGEFSQGERPILGLALRISKKKLGHENNDNQGGYFRCLFVLGEGRQ